MIFPEHVARPFSWLGLTDDFWAVNTDIVVASWLAMAFLLIAVFIGRRCLRRGPSVGLSVYETLMSFFIGLCKDTFGCFNYKYFAFLLALFLFTLFSCLVGVFPFIEEATKDLNTTLALGISSFIYIQFNKIKAHGVGGFLKEFAEPFPWWFPLFAPVHVIGELAKVVSMSFRLFGNILGGSVIVHMVLSAVGAHKNVFFSIIGITLLLALFIEVLGIGAKSPTLRITFKILRNALLVIAWVQLFLGVFEGIIQSFVIAMLSMTYLSIGTQSMSDEHEASSGHDEHAPGTAIKKEAA